MTFFQVASNIQISEGQSAHFEARLTPTEDPNMKVSDPEDLISILIKQPWLHKTYQTNLGGSDEVPKPIVVVPGTTFFILLYYWVDMGTAI